MIDGNQASESVLRLYFSVAPKDVLTRVKDAPESAKFLKKPTGQDVETVRNAAAYLSAASNFPYSRASSDVKELMGSYSAILMRLVVGEAVSVDEVDRCSKFLMDIEEKNYL